MVFLPRNQGTRHQQTVNLISRRMTFVYEMSLISGGVYDDNLSHCINDEVRAATST